MHAGHVDAQRLANPRPAILGEPSGSRVFPVDVSGVRRGGVTAAHPPLGPETRKPPK